MKKKLLSLLLVFLLLLSATPFAFAEDGEASPWPQEVSYAAYLTGGGADFNRREFVLVMNETFVSAAPSLTVRVAHKESVEDAVAQTDIFDSTAVAVEPGSFIENGKTVTRLQVIIPKTFDGSDDLIALTIDAGSFTDAYGNPSGEIVLHKIFRTHIMSDSSSYFCKILQEDLDLSSSLGVGVGDPISLSITCELPFTVLLDGKEIAAGAGGEQKTISFSVSEEGTHKLSFCYRGFPYGNSEFTVFSQQEIYRRQRDSAFADFGDYWFMVFLPLIAIPLTAILPPLGVAAMAGPFVSVVAFAEAVASIFRFVNIWR